MSSNHYDWHFIGIISVFKTALAKHTSLTLYLRKLSLRGIKLLFPDHKIVSNQGGIYPLVCDSVAAVLNHYIPKLPSLTLDSC